MKHGIPSTQGFRFVCPPLVPLFGMILAVMQGHPSFGADLRTTEDAAAAQANSKCDKAPTAIDRLICLVPSLAALDAAIGPALQDYLDRAARPGSGSTGMTGHMTVRSAPTSGSMAK